MEGEHGRNLGDRLAHRTYQRRRLVALGVVVLAVVVIGSAFGGSRHRPPRAVAAPLPRRVLLPVGARATRQNQAIERVLGYTSYISRGTPLHREVALTFDDGPGPYTPKVLDILRRYHAPATFFVVGRSLIYFGATLSQEIADGFVIGDHTQDHKLLTVLRTPDQARQIYEQGQDVRSYQGPFPRLFRPPYGGFDARTLALLHRYGMLMVLWSIDTRDYMQPGVATIVHRALAAQPGSIILMHDAGGNRAQTVAALPRIIKRLRARHLHLVTVPRLVADDPPDPAQPPPRSLAGGAG